MLPHDYTLLQIKSCEIFIHVIKINSQITKCENIKLHRQINIVVCIEKLRSTQWTNPINFPQILILNNFGAKSKLLPMNNKVASNPKQIKGLCSKGWCSNDTLYVKFSSIK